MFRAIICRSSFMPPTSAILAAAWLAVKRLAGGRGREWETAAKRYKNCEDHQREWRKDWCRGNKYQKPANQNTSVENAACVKGNQVWIFFEIPGKTGVLPMFNDTGTKWRNASYTNQVKESKTSTIETIAQYHYLWTWCRSVLHFSHSYPKLWLGSAMLLLKDCFS